MAFKKIELALLYEQKVVNCPHFLIEIRPKDRL